MSVIGFLNQKGGSGKSTLSINVAAELTLRGSRVLLVDADPQGNVDDWRAARGPNVPPFASAVFDRPILHREIPHIRGGYDFVIIDGPARDAALQRSSILSCDIIAIPVQPSGLDLWSTSRFLSLLSAAAKEGSPPSGQVAALVMSRGSIRGILSRGIREQLLGLGLPVLDGTTERLSYREAVTAARTIHEYASAATTWRTKLARNAAQQEIAELTTSILKLKA